MVPTRSSDSRLNPGPQSFPGTFHLKGFRFEEANTFAVSDLHSLATLIGTPIFIFSANHVAAAALTHKLANKFFKIRALVKLLEKELQKKSLVSF